MILEEIRRRYADLSRNQKRIADLISTSYHEVAFMTATQIADQLFINEATVIRFAQRLGYKGYPGMASAIREVVQEELAVTPSAPHDGGLVAELTDAARRLDRAIVTFPSDLGEQLVARIESAMRIIVLAEGMAAHLGGLLAQSLHCLGLRCALIASDDAHLAEALASIDANDLVIGLCVENGGDRIAKAIELSRLAGCKTLGLTASPTSPVARAADTSWSSAHAAPSSLPTVTALAAMIDALIQTLARRRSALLRDHNERIAAMRDRLNPSR
jgi:DNA-binding MurR/RpiR family transcriptional regulator